MQRSYMNIFQTFLLLFVKHVCATGEIPINGRMETAYDDNRVVGWHCTGDSTHPLPMYQLTDETSGRHSGVCNRREYRTQGPSQDIVREIEPDGIYIFQAKTRLFNALTEREQASLKLSVKWKKKKVGSVTERKTLAVRDPFLNNTGWVSWRTQFHLPHYPFESVVLYFDGPPPGVGVEVCNATLHQATPLSDARQQIVKHRTRNLTVRVIFDSKEYNLQQAVTTKLQLRQLDHEFGFGVAVHYDALTKNEKYRDFVKHNFEWATMESALKWYNMEPRKGAKEYKKTDLMLNLLTKDMGMKVRGHCVYWDLASSLPSWLNSLNSTEVRRSVVVRMRDVVAKYKGRFHHWDVTNEILHGRFFSERISPWIYKWMYEETRKYDPGAQLFLNEYDVLSTSLLTQAYVEMVEGFKRIHMSLDAIGVQGHFTGVSHAEIIRDRLDMIGSAGLPIWITELDIVEVNETKRADSFERILRTSFAHPKVRGIVLWTFWNMHTWRGNNSALFEGKNFMPNEVGRRYLALRNEWRTSAALRFPGACTQHDCVFDALAYGGKHEIRVSLPDGTILQKVVDIPASHKPLLIELKAEPEEID